MNMKYARTGWMNNMNDKNTYNHICHIVRLYKRSFRTGTEQEKSTYTRMLVSWLINEPRITIAALSAGKGE